MVRNTTSVGRFVICLMFLAGIDAAAGGNVRGKVRDESGNAMSGVTVQVRALKKGDYTGKDGRYDLKDISSGTYEIEVSILGYKTEKKTVNIVDNGETTVDFRLVPQAVKMNAVEVRATRKMQEQTDTRPSVLTVDPVEAKNKAGAVEDVLRTLQTMPGVVAPNDFSSQLVIRGSGPDQNLILMDNIELFNPYRLYGFISLFNPETVNSISLLTGGFGARYSDRLSAVLDITNRDGARDKGYITGKLNMSLTNANLVLEGALPMWNGSWVVSTRRTYYDLVAGPIAKSLGAVDGDVAFPNFRDVQMKVTLYPVTDHKITINALSSRDNTLFSSGANRDVADSVSITDNSFNDVFAASWLWLASKSYTMNTVVSTYVNTGATSFGGLGGSQAVIGTNDPVTKNDFQRLQDSLRTAGLDVPQLYSISGSTGFTFKKTSIRNEHSWHVDSTHTLDFGLLHDWIYTGVNVDVNFDPRLKALQQSNPRIPRIPDSFENGVSYIRSSAYVQDNVRVAKDVTIQGGLRADFFALIDKFYLAPRLSASYALDKQSTLRAAWGIFYQSPGYEKLFDAQVFLDLTSTAVQNLKAERAMHTILGVDHMLSDEWQIKGEVYYKGFNDLILPQRTQGTVWTVERLPGLADSVYRTRAGWSQPIATIGDSLTTTPVNSARGESYGLEIMLQKVANAGENKLYGWVSYSLALANRYQDGLTIPFNYDRRHNFNLVGGYKISDNVDMSVTFVYGTGFPWTRPSGIKPRVVLIKDTLTGTMVPRIDTDWRGVIFDVDRGGLATINNGRLSDYHRLDIRFTTYARWFDMKWSFYLDVINVYNQKNVVAEQYRVDPETLTLTRKPQYMLPILPTIGFSVAM